MALAAGAWFAAASRGGPPPAAMVPYYATYVSRAVSGLNAGRSQKYAVNGLMLLISPRQMAMVRPPWDQAAKIPVACRPYDVEIAKAPVKPGDEAQFVARWVGLACSGIGVAGLAVGQGTWIVADGGLRRVFSRSFLAGIGGQVGLTRAEIEATNGWAADEMVASQSVNPLQGR